MALRVFVYLYVCPHASLYMFCCVFIKAEGFNSFVCSKNQAIQIFGFRYVKKSVHTQRAYLFSACLLCLSFRFVSFCFVMVASCFIYIYMLYIYVSFNKSLKKYVKYETLPKAYLQKGATRFKLFR